MFKLSWKLRKILRKIYHFIGFMSLFLIFLSPVYADELPSCYDDYLHEYSVLSGCNYYVKSQNTYQTMSSCQGGSATLTPMIPITANETLYIKFPSLASGTNVNMFAVSFYDDNMELLNFNSYSPSGKITYSYDNTTGILQLLVTNTTYKYVMPIFSSFLSFNNFSRPVPWGSQLTGQLAYANIDLSTCPTPPEPPTPPSNAVYNSFLEVFLDRFEFLATSFTSNPYLFTFIGIIIAWIILELFLRILHIRGGYKK